MASTGSRRASRDAIRSRPGRGQEPLPGLGEPHGAGVAGEQGDAEFTLEPGDPLGQRLLGEEQPPGRPAEVQFLGSGDERADLCEDIAGPAGWEDAATTLTDLYHRRIRGNAVLTIPRRELP
jgi:hypothetical protein